MQEEIYISVSADHASAGGKWWTYVQIKRVFSKSTTRRDETSGSWPSELGRCRVSHFWPSAVVSIVLETQERGGRIRTDHPYPPESVDTMKRRSARGCVSDTHSRPEP
ncbi:hypothetical protein C446_01693 [Halobiforma nitratireducens JCM 10879]|uniref:Uncharacterized protein n=1 Tax=Halobiforma nitratireducens JCM 10879 TaxID=1227454 RepID=M0MKN9_9EURY|nr:hypothetical protein C446_01693 [Halobiforma nitratireducens JCM 10879]